LDELIVNRGIEPRLSTIPIISGALTFIEDAQNCYIDTPDNTRIQITDIIYLDTEVKRLAITNPIQNKAYFVKESKIMYRYDIKWLKISSYNINTYYSTNVFTIIPATNDTEVTIPTNTIGISDIDDIQLGALLFDINNSVAIIKTVNATMITARLINSQLQATSTPINNIYIDTNFIGENDVGTFDRPFRTWQKMLTNCNSNLENAGLITCINIKAGSEILDVTNISNFKNTTIQGNHSNNTTIRFNSNVNIENTIKLTISNCTILSANNVLTIRNNLYVLFDNCIVNSIRPFINYNNDCIFNLCKFINSPVTKNATSTNLDRYTTLFQNCNDVSITAQGTAYKNDNGRSNDILNIYHCNNAIIQSNVAGTTIQTTIINTTIRNSIIYVSPTVNFSLLSGSFTNTDYTLTINALNIDLGTFNLMNVISTLTGNIVQTSGLNSLQVQDTYIRPYGNINPTLKSHLDAIADKLNNVDGVVKEANILLNGSTTDYNLVKNFEWHIDSVTGEISINILNKDVTNGNELITNILGPAATENTDGFMSADLYKTLQLTVQGLASLQNQGGVFIGISFATYADLQAYAIPSATDRKSVV